MDFDIVIPTYKRKDKLIRLLNSIPKQDNLKIWVYFDNNDNKTAAWFEIQEKVNELIIMNKKYQAFGIWNYHLQNHFKSDIFCWICDDTEVFPDTFKNVEKHFINKFPDMDGVVTFNQINLPSGSDSAMGCVGRKFIERYKNYSLYCPDYVSFYADSEIGDYAKKLNKFHWGEDCKIVHYHPVSKLEKPDETHWIIRGKDKNIDIKINAERKKRNLLWGESFELIGRENYDR